MKSSPYLRSLAATVLALPIFACVAPANKAPRAPAARSIPRSTAPVDALRPSLPMVAAFENVCAELDYRILRVQVDDSELPVLLYGVLEGTCDYRALRRALISSDWATYQACVTAADSTGANTVFALHLSRPGDHARDGASNERVQQRLRELALLQR